MLSCLLMRSKEVGNAQSVQQTTDIFFNSPPTLLGEKKCQGVPTQKFVDKYTKHVCLFIQNISHAWFLIAVLEEDKYVVKHLNEAPLMHFPGVLSRTRVTEPQFLSLALRSCQGRGVAQGFGAGGENTYPGSYLGVWEHHVPESFASVASCHFSGVGPPSDEAVVMLHALRGQNLLFPLPPGSPGPRGGFLQSLRRLISVA